MICSSPGVLLVTAFAYLASTSIAQHNAAIEAQDTLRLRVGSFAAWRLLGGRELCACIRVEESFQLHGRLVLNRRTVQ